MAWPPSPAPRRAHPRLAHPRGPPAAAPTRVGRPPPRHPPPYRLRIPEAHFAQCLRYAKWALAMRSAGRRAVRARAVILGQGYGELISVGGTRASGKPGKYHRGHGYPESRSHHVNTPPLPTPLSVVLATHSRFDRPGTVLVDPDNSECKAESLRRSHSPRRAHTAAQRAVSSHAGCAEPRPGLCRATRVVRATERLASRLRVQLWPPPLLSSRRERPRVAELHSRQVAHAEDRSPVQLGNARQALRDATRSKPRLERGQRPTT